MELPSIYQSVIHRSRYSRYLTKEQRRESWEETVDRLVTYLKGKTKDADQPYCSNDNQPVVVTQLILKAVYKIRTSPSQ